MCGVAGFIPHKAEGHLNCHQIISEMTNSISHRGPDSSGIWIDDKSKISIGHRRLAIIDLTDSGKQPMSSHDDRYVLAFNGEIYNHLELRSLLEKEVNFPCIWRGTSDTETMLACIMHWGLKKSLSLFVGMFAFCLWDKSTETLYLARDRLGEKPLYYGWVNKSFVFGSELKALKAYPGFANEINRDALKEYLRFNYVPSPLSIYKGISKLEPGHLLELNFRSLKKQKVKISSYWSLSEIIKNARDHLIEDELESVDLVEKQLSNSVKDQMISDVPLGAFLSGGIDSSLIVALMQENSPTKVQTFTIALDNQYLDESKYASAVAKHLNTDHNELLVTAQDALNIIPKLPEIYDEPFADSSQIPTYFVCKAARSNVTVALSGDAGDEVFGGYNRYFLGPVIWNKISWLPYSSRKILANTLMKISVESWNKFGFFSNLAFKGSGGVSMLGDKVHKLSTRLDTIKDFNDLYLSLVTEWKDPSNLVKHTKFNKSDARLSVHDLEVSDLKIEGQASSMMYLDSLSYLPDDILCKVDRAAMANSLETRAPFLDHRLIEIAWQLPESLKLNNSIGKLPLRKILEKYVPNQLIDRPKAGFGIPLGEWLRGPLKSWAQVLLDPTRIEQEGFFYSEPIEKIWIQHLSGHRDWTPRLWSILMFQSWLEQQ